MSGKSLKEVNWAKVGVSALSGGVSAAVPGGFITAAVIGGTTDVAFDMIDGNINSVGDAVKSFAWGAVKEVVSQGVGKALDKGIGKLAGKFAGGGKKEVFYRTMSQSDYDFLRMTGELPSTGETFISPTKSFSCDYDGVMVKFELNSGTTSMLEEIGLSNGDRAMLAKKVYMKTRKIIHVNIMKLIKKKYENKNVNITKLRNKK